MKWIPLSLTVTVVGFSGAAFADDWFTPYCPSGTLKRNGLGVDHACEKVVTEDADCPKDYTLKVDGVFKDKCEMVTSATKAVECKLNIGEIAANWTLVSVSGADHCEHNDKSKGQREVKCTGGFQLDIDGGAGNKDRCIDQSTVKRVDATCPSGADHKVAGKDKCEKVTRTAPSFK
jgi:hypothetical protein